MTDAPADDSAKTPALVVDGLTFSYNRGEAVVNDVSLSIQPGSFVGLIGPNGAGKSTLVDCISGVNTAYRGQVFLGGQDVSRWSLHKIAALSVARTFQVPRVYRRMTVLTNLMLAARDQTGETLLGALLGRWRDQDAINLTRAWGMLKQFGLEGTAYNYGSELSGGQARLVELCRLLMFKPRLILLDEPFAGVSPANRERLAQEILYLRKDPSVAILMIEHRLEWVERLCERVLVMDAGQVIAEGSMSSLRLSQRVLDSYLGIRADEMHG